MSRPDGRPEFLLIPHLVFIQTKPKQSHSIANRKACQPRAGGGRETGLAVYHGLFTRSGYALDRPSYNPKAPAAAEKSCTRQALSGRPFYRAKMPSIATPVVHGNRPAGRMPPNFMTALGGRGEAQSALLAFGGHETGPAVYRGLFSRSGYAFDRLSFEISLPTFGQDRK